MGEGFRSRLRKVVDGGKEGGKGSGKGMDSVYSCCFGVFEIGMWSKKDGTGEEGEGVKK